MGTEHVIVTEGLTRAFGAFQAVKGIDLRVPEGVVYGFLGPNGAGKTTTIRMILDLIHPTAGKVYLFGEPFDRSAWQRLAKVGTLVESPSLYAHLTGRENLEVLRRLLDLPKANIDRVLHLVGLEGAGNKLVRQYSLGMQQRLALALALLNEPTLLILDEPTNGLDPSGIQEIRTLIRDMPKTTGTSVFLSSHLLSEVELMATHVGIIQQGELLYQGELAAMKKRWGPVLRVSVDRPAEAATALSERGWKIRLNGNGLEVLAVDESATGEINRALLQDGFQVRQLYLHQASLEEMFLELTGPSGGAA